MFSKVTMPVCPMSAIHDYIRPFGGLASFTKIKIGMAKALFLTSRT
jgi:hypothetical protein